jgi:hypothetical protein
MVTVLRGGCSKCTDVCTRVSHISCQRHLNDNEIKDKITTNSLDIYCLETSVVHFGGTVPTSHMPGYMQSRYFNGMD